jgi:2-dehydro-3-deoxyphosphogluconate aldolase/(4S)-4-hydroxy-2-oxoglutarate aldolase
MRMNTQTACDFIESRGIVAGMRGAFGPENALRVANALVEEGIAAFELTMNSEQPIEAMRAIKREFGAAACVGMGTVLDVDTAQRVLDAGADFVVSPAFQPEVVEVAQAAEVLIAPGVMTPTEAVHAWSMQVSMLKIFPIGSLGIDYFKAMMGPLGHLKFMCNGGMNADNAGKFMASGAAACGMAGWLTGDGSLPIDTIRERARQLRAVVDPVLRERGVLPV